MCTIVENPHLIDTETYLFHVEDHVRDTVIDVVAH